VIKPSEVMLPRSAHRMVELVLITLAVSLIIAPTCAESGAKNNAYLFTFNHRLVGVHRLFVDADEVRFEEPEMDLVYVAQKPTWHPFAFNDKHKLFCDLDREEQFALWTHAPKTDGVPQKVVVHGLPALVYRVVPRGKQLSATHSLPVPSLSDFGKQLSRRERSDMAVVVRDELVRTAQLKFPKAVYDVCSRLSGTAEGDGIPLQSRRILSDGRVDYRFDLTGWKRASLTPSQCAVPKGYKQVGSYRDIVQVSVRSTVEDMTNDMRTFEPIGGNK
jgi:hypothetical protein